MARKILVGIIAAVIVVLIVLGTAIITEIIKEKETMAKCGMALTEYNLIILYDGEKVIGQYYWFNTVDDWSDVKKIDNGVINWNLANDSMYGEPIKDSSLKIVRLDRSDDLNYNEIYNLNYALDNDPRYERGESEINQTRILEAVRQYSINPPEYFEIKNFFSNEPFYTKNITVDLKTRQIVSTSTSENKDLWIGCEY